MLRLNLVKQKNYNLVAMLTVILGNVEWAHPDTDLHLYENENNQVCREGY